VNRKPIVLGVVIALLAVGGFAGYQYFFGNPGGKATFNARCAYNECGWTGNATVGLGSPYPLQCPRCGKNSVLHTATCKKCGNKQILVELLAQHIPGNEKLMQPTICEKCGGPIRHGDSNPAEVRP
jgi:hypothetical protein